MLTATARAISGSRISQPVSATAATPTITPTDVHTSVIRCLPSASRMIERSSRPARRSTTPTARLINVAPARDGEADADAVDRLRVEQPPERGHADADGRDEDERPLHARGEVLGLLVPVGVILVGGLEREPQREHRHRGRDEVHDRLRRVGQQTDRPGQQIGDGLERDRRQRGGDGQPQEPEQTVATSPEDRTRQPAIGSLRRSFTGRSPRSWHELERERGDAGERDGRDQQRHREAVGVGRGGRRPRRGR